MPGTITFRPVEANITHDTNWLGKMDPYCRFSIGANHAQSSVCRHGGTRPHWGDTVSLSTTGLTSGVGNVVRLELFDKDKFRPDDHIAYTDIPLSEIEQLGSVSKWYPLYHRKKPAGEILIEAAIQQQQQLVVEQVPVTTYVQETVTVLPSQIVDQTVGQSYVVNESITTQGVPFNQGLIGTANLGTYNTGTVDPNFNTGLIGGTSTYVSSTNTGLIGQNPGFVGQNTGLVGNEPHLASKVSAFGPSGGLPHGNHLLKGQTNAGYSQRPGYTLGDTEADTTLQSNLDSNGGGLFNKPGRERRAEPYALSNPGTYGIPHGQTIDTAGHLRPDVTLERQAPIGTINHPGITGYVDGYNKPQQELQGLQQQSAYNSGLNTGLGQPGSYSTGIGQPGSYSTGLGQPGSYSTGLGQAGSYGTGLAQPGSYTSGLGQAGSYGTGLGQQGLGQQGLGQQGLVQGNLIQGLSQHQGLGQQGLGQGNLNAGLGQQGLGQGNLNAGLGNQTYGQGQI